MIDDAAILGRALEFINVRDDAAARATLRSLQREDPLPSPRVTGTYIRERPDNIPPRPKMPPTSLVSVLRRDEWQCNYCGRRLVLAPLIAAIGALYPDEFPFPSHAMPARTTHPAAIRVYPNVDHVTAGRFSGDWTNDGNLVAACTPCNTLKSDRSGWPGLSFTRQSWDGLTRYYEMILKRLPTVTASQIAWACALGIST
jgi:hypothetical protein